MEYTYIHNHQSQFLEWFGSPEIGWKYPTKTLGELYPIGTGGTPERESGNYYGGDIPWVKSTEVNFCHIVETQEHITKEGLKASNCKPYNPNTVLLAMYGQGSTRGKVAILNCKATVNQAIAAIQVDNPDDSEFVFQELKCMYEHVRNLASGGNQHNLNLKIISNIHIAVAPPELKSHFVEIARQADKSKFDGFKSQFIEMFGTLTNPKFEVKNLGNCCDVERGGSPRPISEYITDSPEGINWIKIGDADEGMYITSTKEKILTSGIKKSRMVFKGDLLLSNSMSFGRPYILNIDGCIHDGWLVLHFDKALFNSEYLCSYLSQQSTYTELAKLADGAVVSNLNKEIVKILPVIAPPMALQEEFTAVIHQSDKSKYYEINET